jgi:hypothetical protein
MRTATLVGIDGTGKTTTARRVAEQRGVVVLHAIRPHVDPASPYAELSTNCSGWPARRRPTCSPS